MTLTLTRKVEFGPPVVMTTNFCNLSSLGDHYSRDISIQGTENLVPEKCSHIILHLLPLLKDGSDNVYIHIYIFFFFMHFSSTVSIL